MTLHKILKNDTSLAKSTVRGALARKGPTRVASVAKKIEAASRGRITRWQLLYPDEPDQLKIAQKALKKACLIIWHNSMQRGDTPEHIERDLINLVSGGQGGEKRY